jgi:hypothetical protein
MLTNVDMLEKEVTHSVPLGDEHWNDKKTYDLCHLQRELHR